MFSTISSIRAEVSSGYRCMLKCSYMVGDKKTEGESSSQSQNPQTTSMKVELKPFANKENFTLWQRRMKHVLAHQNLSV